MALSGPLQKGQSHLRLTNRMECGGSAAKHRFSVLHLERMPPTFALNFDNPKIGIAVRSAAQIGFNIGVRSHAVRVGVRPYQPPGEVALLH
jgi:hypothetical protein